MSFDSTKLPLQPSQEQPATSSRLHIAHMYCGQTQGTTQEAGTPLRAGP